jgi:hypothetical protein
VKRTIGVLLTWLLAVAPIRCYASYDFKLLGSTGNDIGNLSLPVADCHLIISGTSFMQCPDAALNFNTGLHIYDNSDARQIETTGWHFDGSVFTGLSQIYFVMSNSGDGITLDLTSGFFNEYPNWLGGGQGGPPLSSGPVVPVTSAQIPEPVFFGTAALVLTGVAGWFRCLRRARPSQQPLLLRSTIPG